MGFILRTVTKMTGAGLINYCANCSCRNKAKVDHNRRGCMRCGCMMFRKMK